MLGTILSKPRSLMMATYVFQLDGGVGTTREPFTVELGGIRDA